MAVDALKPTLIDAPDAVSSPVYFAEDHRRGYAALLAGGATAGVARSGVLDPRGLVPSLSANKVQVSAGPAAIASVKGAYLTGAATTLTDATTLVAADATNPRRDRIVLEVLDPDNGGSAGRKAQMRVIPGAPSPTALSGGGYPPEPALATTLGWVDVPKNGGGSPSVTDQRVYTTTAGAPIPVRNLAERDALPKWDGARALRLDASGLVDACIGGAWVSPVESISLTPPDAGWTVNGGLVKTRTVGGLTLIQCECRVNRTAPSAGGPFTIGTGFTSLLASFIPVGWRPALVTDGPSILNSSGAAGKAEPIVRVGTDGTMAFRSPSGGTLIQGAAGDYFTITASWWQ